MQSGQQTTTETGRHGHAVPIALLALVIVGILVTGAFYAFSHEPDRTDADKVSVGQTAAPAPAVRVEQSQDSSTPDSLAVPGDTAASGAAAGHVPLSVNPLDSVSLLPSSADAPSSRPVRRDSRWAPTPQSNSPY